MKKIITKLYNVRNNINLKKATGNVVMTISPEIDIENLIDINSTIWKRDLSVSIEYNDKFYGKDILRVFAPDICVLDVPKANNNRNITVVGTTYKKGKDSDGKNIWGSVPKGMLYSIINTFKRSAESKGYNVYISTSKEGEKILSPYEDAVKIYAANYKKYGSNALPRRNTEMVMRTDVSICFWNGVDQIVGDFINKSIESGTPTYVFTRDGRMMVKYNTKEGVCINKNALIAKLTSVKSMLACYREVEITRYEKFEGSRAFDYSSPKPDYDNIIDGEPQPLVEKVFKTYYKQKFAFFLDNMNFHHNKYIRWIAKEYKLPIATVAGDEIVDERYRDEDEYYMSIFDWFITEPGSIDFDEKTKRLLIKKYREIGQGKKNVLLKYFGCNNPNEFVNFVYATQNFIFHVKGTLYAFDYRTDGASLYTGMLVLHGDEKRAYEELVELAKRGLCYNLTGFPELEQYKPDNYEWVRENPLHDDEEDTPLD